jgi:hypothetical protein
MHLSEEYNLISNNKSSTSHALREGRGFGRLFNISFEIFITVISQSLKLLRQIALERSESNPAMFP